MKERIRHLLCVLIFGLVVPVFLLLRAYPLGPSEMFERVKFEWNLPHYTKEVNLSLSGGFNPRDFNYALNTSIIQQADENTRINIIVDENVGGAVYVLEELQDAIKASKAFIVLTVSKFGLSCGTLILGSGNYLILPDDSLLLFHLGSVNGQRTSDYSDDPVLQDAARQMHVLYAPYRKWITDKEFDKFKHGGDIFVTGASICHGKDGREAPVLFTYNGGCVIKGAK